MKHSTIIVSVCVVLATVTVALGQESEQYLSTDLETTLRDLKTSADGLNQQNAQLIQENAQLRQSLSQLQLRLGQLHEEEAQLTQQALKLQDKDESKAKQISLAQKNLYELDAKLEKQVASIKETKDQIAKLAQEDQNLTEQLNQIQQVSLNNSNLIVEDPQSDLKRKEKINLLKMIDQSHLRQQHLNEAIVKLKPSGQESETAQLMAQREVLQSQLNGYQDELASLSSIHQLAEVVDTEDVKLLAGQMTALEKNYDQLRDLWSKMQEKAQSLRMAPTEKIEKDKLSKNLMDLNQDSAKLKSELRALREQMVELDKRKTKLQHILNQQP